MFPKDRGYLLATPMEISPAMDSSSPVCPMAMEMEEMVAMEEEALEGMEGALGGMEGALEGTVGPLEGMVGALEGMEEEEDLCT